jgi:four helix bundle protein
MKESNIIVDKSYKFSVRIVKLYKFLTEEKKEYILSKQILRCGTSIGANIEEAIGARTKRDFINTMAIAYKEARETKYWLRLIKDCEYLDEKLFKSIFGDCEEINKILCSILITSKRERE